MFQARSRAEDDRRESRDEVFHRTRATGSGGLPLVLLVVNLSPGGLMARLDHPLAPGDPLRILLPDLGMVGAQVRWALGGRIGCQFDTPVSASAYRQLLAAMDGATNSR